MAFQFRFERILRLRRHKEEEKMNELGVEMKKLTDLINQVRQHKEHSELKLSELREKEKSSINVTELIAYRSYLSRLTVEESELNNRVQTQKEIVEQKRAELLEATKERKVMERLREVKEGEYWKEFWRKEEKETDDNFSSRLRHSQGGMEESRGGTRRVGSG